MRTITRIQPLLLSVLLTTTLAAPATPPTLNVRGSIWVADEQGSSLTVIDATSNKVRATLSGVPMPHNVQLAPDGKSAWAVLGENAQAVKIDTQTFQVLGRAPQARLQPT